MSAMTAEAVASSRLREILGAVPLGGAIQRSDALRDFESALERLLPAELTTSYSWWRGESLDAFQFTVARKTASLEAEFIGLCLLISDQSWTPLHLRMRVADHDNLVAFLELKLGEAGSGPGGMLRTPYGSTRETKVLDRLAGRIDAIDWAYTIERGAA